MYQLVKGLFYFNLFLSINFLFFSVKVLGCVLLIIFRNKNMKVLCKSGAVIFRPLERYILVHCLFYTYIKQISRYCNAMNAKISDYYSLFHLFLFSKRVN